MAASRAINIRCRILYTYNSIKLISGHRKVDDKNLCLAAAIGVHDLSSSNRRSTMLSHAQAQDLFEEVVQRVYRQDCDSTVVEAIGKGLSYVKSSAEL